MRYIPSREALALLSTAADALAPHAILGITREDAGEVSVLCAFGFGLGAYSMPSSQLPAPLRPSAKGIHQAPHETTDGVGHSFINWHLTTIGVKQLLSFPIEDGGPPARFWVGLRELSHPSADQMNRFQDIARECGRVLRDTEPPARRATKLELLDGLLTTLMGVLDIRHVFDRVSEIAAKVLPHDALGIAELLDDGDRVRVHATQGIGPIATPFDIATPDRRLVMDAGGYNLIDDMTKRPDYAEGVSVAAGMRALLMVPIIVEGRQFGGLGFYSKTPASYTRDDVMVAKRIADHVALALSHQRLAEQARDNEALRMRRANLELLDELLAAQIDLGALHETCDRISAVTSRVLPHDAVTLAIILPDGVRARIYTTSNLPPRPEIAPVPAEFLRNPNWEHEIIDRLSLRTEPQHVNAVRLGFESALRVPIRLEGRFAGTVIFASRAPAAFNQTDVLIVRRIADRIALALSRDREAQASKRADAATARASELESRVRVLTEELDARTGFRRVVGESPEWRRVLTQAAQVAPNETTVLLLGESGTGKEVIARFVHRASPRTKGPFIALNCAALPEQLLEAELFGYERGAFTGAMQSKPGQLELAAGGTLFLDEVGEMSLASQAKFLRVLQEREFQRLGGTRVLRTDARIVAATNRDLQQAIAQRQFREDLYYRLNIFAIQLPPLRERLTDVIPLSEAFLKEIGRGISRAAAGISLEARQRLMAYHWPGNVRELHNVLERASILCEGGVITPDHLALTVPAPRPLASAASPANVNDTVLEKTTAPASARPSSAGDLKSLERDMIVDALREARFNKSHAAKALGLTRQQLYLRLKRYGLE
jgi:transcriptional regulator with GAF, ATPase, and Fis domain